MDPTERDDWVNVLIACCGFRNKDHAQAGKKKVVRSDAVDTTNNNIGSGGEKKKKLYPKSANKTYLSDIIGLTPKDVDIDPSSLNRPLIRCIALYYGRLLLGLGNDIVIFNLGRPGDPAMLDRCGLLQGHTDTVLSLVVKDGLIYSGSKDGTVRVWLQLFDSNGLALESHLQSPSFSSDPFSTFSNLFTGSTIAMGNSIIETSSAVSSTEFSFSSIQEQSSSSFNCLVSSISSAGTYGCSLLTDLSNTTSRSVDLTFNCGYSVFDDGVRIETIKNIPIEKNNKERQLKRVPRMKSSTTTLSETNVQQNENEPNEITNETNDQNPENPPQEKQQKQKEKKQDGLFGFMGKYFW